MRYFAEFPTITYQIAGTGGAYKLVPDIFRRVRARSKILGNLSFLDAYDINEGDSPEAVAYKAYGSTDYFFIVLLVNNIINRYYDWPLDEYNFQQFCKDKYDNPDGIHHYEKIQSSGKQKGDGPADYSHMICCNSTDIGAVSVSNIQYERRLQDKKRQIQILLPQYLPAVEDEFTKLVRK